MVDASPLEYFEIGADGEGAVVDDDDDDDVGDDDVVVVVVVVVVDGGDGVVLVVLEVGQVPVGLAAELLEWLPAVVIGWSDR